MRNRANLTRQLQAGVDRGVFDHRGRVAAVVHVQLGALRLPVDHRQAQTESLSVRLGPTRDGGGGGCWEESPSVTIPSFY